MRWALDVEVVVDNITTLRRWRGVIRLLALDAGVIDSR
jgi:hypothetical protein